MSTESREPREGQGLPSEEELLREARALLPPVDSEPRPGFASRVALRAAEARRGPAGIPGWRWGFAGAGLVAVAALLVLALPRRAPAPAPMAMASNDRAELMLRAPGGELAVAQRLDLYEELTLVQNEDALEEMDVVSVLDELPPEVKP